MSSSISSSDPRRAWGRFCRVLILSGAICLLGVIAIAYAVDPYDTGRSSLLTKSGVRPQGPRTAAASRGRDQAFDSVIIGNSHIQLLSPERLKAKTGFSFVQLAVPASGPREQFVLADWFLRHRETPPKALIIGIDDRWCLSDLSLTSRYPFPYWLFSADFLTYAAGLVHFDMLEEIPRRLSYIFQNQERARPDGYWDYEKDYLRTGHSTLPELMERLEKAPPDWPINSTDQYPALERFLTLAKALPQSLALIIVFPPNYIALQSPPGSVRALSDQACKDRFRTVTDIHPKTVIVDWRVDRPENRRPEWYFDQTHYRQPIAQAVEDDIAKALQGLN